MSSATQRYQDALSGQYGASSGYYGHGPVQSYTRPLTARRIQELSDAWSNPTQGRALVDPFGKLVGYEKGALNALRLRQDRLFAQAAGATATALLGPGNPALPPDTRWLRPEQIEQLFSLRARFGGSEAQALTQSGLSTPAAATIPGGTEGAVGVQPGMDPKLLLYAGAGLLLLLLLRS